MKKGFVLLTGCMMLAGCTKPLPSAEVLERSMLASQRLESAAFSVSVNGTYVAQDTGQQVAGIMTSDGVMENGGTKMSQQMQAELTWGGVTRPAHAEFATDFVVIDHETFFKISELALEPNSAENMFTFLAPMMDSWWRLPSSTGSVMIAPDPNVLKSQAQIVDVVRDDGIQKTEHGKAYHYVVTLNQQKFLRWLEESGQWSDEQRDSLKDFKADGELWIDPATFYLKAALWKIDAAPALSGVVNATIDIRLRDHDTSQHVTAPSDAREFPSMEFSLSGETDVVAPQEESDTLQ